MLAGHVVRAGQKHNVYLDLEMELGPQPTPGRASLVSISEVLHSTSCTAFTKPPCGKPLTSMEVDAVSCWGIQSRFKSLPGHGELPQPQTGYSLFAICSSEKSSIQQWSGFVQFCFQIPSSSSVLW